MLRRHTSIAFSSGRCCAMTPRPESYTARSPPAGDYHKNAFSGTAVASTSLHSRRHTSPGVAASPPGHDAAGAEEDPRGPLSLMQRIRRIKRRGTGFKVMGLDPSPELVAISMVYFVQGILGLSRLATSFFFKDDLHIDPAEVAVLTGLSSIPWMIKPLYGFLSDAVPLFGYRRRSYLVLCGLVGTSAWMTLSYGVHEASGAVACMILASLSTAFSDVVVDSIVVERARGHPQAVAGSLQSLCWASAAIGGITSAYFSGSLVQDHGPRFVFGLTAFFPLVVSASALLIDERPVGRGAVPRTDGSHSGAAAALLAPPGPGGVGVGADLPHAASAMSGGPSTGVATDTIFGRLYLQGVALWGAVRQRGIIIPALFAFMWQATPSADSAMFYYQTNVLNFTPEFLGRVRLAGSLASLLGVGIFNTWLKAVPLRRLLLWIMILGTLLSSTQLILISGLHRQWGISDQVFVLGDSVILTVLGQVSWMPILVLAARMCPEGVEATLFATLMSIVNSGSIMGGALGAGLTKLYGVTSDRFDNLFALVTTCIALNLVPAAFLRMLPEQVDREREEGSQGHGQAQSGAGGGPGEVRMAEGSGSGKGRHESEAMEAGLAGPGPGSGGEERAPLLGGKVARD